VNGFLLDTNILSELIEPKPEPRVLHWIAATDEDLLFLSVLALGDIRKGIAGLRAGPRRARLESWLETGLRSRFRGRMLPIDEAVADRWGTLTAQASGRGRPVPVIDGLLAATALHHNLTLVTRNASDVAATGALVMNPWD
jgi:toxin FitB